jgi:uncharacterized phage protein (TIGR01671 family)
MREIKFRVWAKFESGTHGMVDHDGIRDWSIEDLLEDEKDVVMQYTGLKDKNGKEIYEGDIIIGDIRNDTESFEIGEVRWVRQFACWWIQSIVNPDIYTTFETQWGQIDQVEEHWSETQFTVIGNIYENPELLDN